MHLSREEREQESLRRRLEVLKLPVAPLRHAGYLSAGWGDGRWHGTPEAVGVGPDNQCLAVWASREQPGLRLVTVHDGSPDPVRSVQLDGCLEPRFVQLLPDDRILLVRSRNRGGANAEVWTFDGRRKHEGDLGDAIEDVLTTPTGAIWVSYFDEALAGTGPQTHGLARFTPDLEPEWLYPHGAGLPPIFNCYALNVAGETAWTYAYNRFHLVSVTDGDPTDHGAAPYRGADALLTDGATGVLVGGYGPDYDLLTVLRIEDGKVSGGGEARLILPDGIEVRVTRKFCRGPQLHVFMGTFWYRADLDSLTRR
ncbi:hypothetical protein D7147_22440 [Micromonospora musae]|uniref:Uncharacterized protein n=1 Tax=Micromonospora musae TaxID=1894970 RepID=A0ABX9R0L3_9ACTN|nr:hypothetical protein [Micromonospora musae]RKN16530.1 hypothetical protein D7147_22440 [Micromonospora musae]